jgi:hypothetical protein
VGLEGVTAYRVFFLDFEDFDVPRGYKGVAGGPVGHLFIEARKLTDSPKNPCIGSKQVEETDIKGWRTTLYICPNDSSYIERVARHGEGANVGHVLMEWKSMGVDYLASVHGHITTNVRLLRQLVASMIVVQP